MSGRSSKKLRKEVAAQYADQEAKMRAKIIKSIGDAPLWRRIVIAWRMVDKSPLVSELHLHVWYGFIKPLVGKFRKTQA